MKLNKKLVYEGTISLKTGLHIGGTNETMSIGGLDKFVVRNPINNKPYIPGSSLKGKMRSLIELKYGCFSEGKTNGPSDDKTSVSGKLFGVGAGSKASLPSRLIVRDAELDTSNEDIFKNCDLLYTESKTEVSIDRITANSVPRTIERVPAGAKFKLNMVLNIFEGENEAELKSILKEAIELLENDYLGGNGSRGYGQVELRFGEDSVSINDYTPKTA